jgi:hypothetical protein
VGAEYLPLSSDEWELALADEYLERFLREH